jgi:hypothetical protein
MNEWTNYPNLRLRPTLRLRARGRLRAQVRPGFHGRGRGGGIRQHSIAGTRAGTISRGHRPPSSASSERLAALAHAGGVMVERSAAAVLIWMSPLHFAALLDGARPLRIDAVAWRRGVCRADESRGGDEEAERESCNKRVHIASPQQMERPGTTTSMRAVWHEDGQPGSTVRIHVTLHSMIV